MNNLLNFKLWFKEQTVASAGSGAVSSNPTGSAAANTTSTGATLSSDIAKVPMRLGCGQDCGKDFFKNWYYKKKKKRQK